MNVSNGLECSKALSIKVFFVLLLVSTLSQCGGSSTVSGGQATAEENVRIKQALDIMSRSTRVHSAATKYRYQITKDLVIRGIKAFGACWVDRVLIELDADFVATSDMRVLVSTILHEVGHCELGHRTYTQENEQAAAAWQSAAIVEVYETDLPSNPPKTI